MAQATATNDTITIDAAGDIDRQWVNSAMPDDGLRIVSHRISGNRSRTFLTIPGNDNSPCYERINGHFQHVDGPTLAEWQRQQHAASMPVWYVERSEATAMTQLLDDARHSQEARELAAWAGGA